MNQWNHEQRLHNLQLEHTERHIHMRFDSPVEVVSSAILNGGFTVVDHIVNMKVPENFSGEQTRFLSPDKSLLEYARLNGWQGNIIGMMTAAHMDSFRRESLCHEDVIVECFLTSGLSNARRTGDPADWPFLDQVEQPSGTINMILGTNARLTPAAMVETIMMMTETKSAVLQELNILSPITSKIATGTGTDSCAVFHGSGRAIQYCGKHVLFGEMIAAVVSHALHGSLAFYNSTEHC